MYLKHPVLMPTGKTVTRNFRNTQTNELTTFEEDEYDYVTGKITDAQYKSLAKSDVERLKKADILFKTEKEAFTIPEPEGMKLVDTKKDDQVEKAKAADK